MKKLILILILLAFVSVVYAEGEILWSQNLTTTGAWLAYDLTDYKWECTNFTVNSTNYIQKFEIYFGTETSSGAGVWAELWSGNVNPTSFLQNGTKRSTSDLSANSWNYFNLSAPYQVSSGTTYWACFRSDTALATNVDWRCQNTVGSLRRSGDSITWATYGNRGSLNVYNTSSGAPPAGTPTATFLKNPVSNYLNNTLGQNITVSCTENGKARLFFSTTTPPTDRLLINSTTSIATWIINKSVVNVSSDYYYMGNCSNATSVATTIEKFTFDNVTPTQTLNANNFFKVNNASAVSNFGTYSLRVNLTLNEDRDLYGFQINITLANGTSIYNYTNTTLTGHKTYNFTALIGIANITPSQLLTIDTWRSDSSTAKEISTYNNKKIVDGLEFNTAEGNKVILKSEDSAEFTANREIDRYTINIAFADGLEKKRTLYLISDHKIDFMNNPEHLGHFVIFNSWEKGGNWIDMIGADSPLTVTKINDYQYKLEFSKLKADTKFKSIGGLNIARSMYSWFYGNYTSYQYPSPSVSEFEGNIYLNISKGGAISDIKACLFFNDTYNCNLNQRNYSTYVVFNASIPAIEIASDTVYTYLFNTSVLQTDNTVYKFNTTLFNYTIRTWGIDDCTLYSNTAFYINTLNEKTGIPHITNLTASLIYYIDGAPAITKNYQNNLYNNNSFRFCKSSSNLVFYGDVLSIIEGVDIGTRTFNLDNVLLNGSFNAYVLSTASTTNYITFRIQSSGGSAIDGAKMNIYRSVNASDTLIFYGVSDFAGQIVTYLDQLYKYTFIINATDYPIKTFELQPSDTSYTLTLTQAGQTLYNNPYDGIMFKISPNSTLMNVTNAYQNITFEVIGSVREIGIELSNHDYICIPASCTNSLNSSGTVSVSIKANSTGTFNTAFYFITGVGGYDRIYVNDGLIKVVPFIFTATKSLIHLFQDIKANTSPNVITIIAVIISLIFVGIGASLGLSGALLILPVVGANIFLSLPMIGFINPFVGLIVSIMGIAIYVGANVRNT